MHVITDLSHLNVEKQYTPTIPPRDIPIDGVSYTTVVHNEVCESILVCSLPFCDSMCTVCTNKNQQVLHFETNTSITYFSPHIAAREVSHTSLSCYHQVLCT